jgi:hypothetical protein
MTRNWIFLLLIILAACGDGQNGGQSDSLVSIRADSLVISQSTPSLQDTLPGKRNDKLICIDYPGYDGNEPEIFLEGKELLSEEYVRHYLFLNADSVYQTNIWSLDTVGRESMETYLSNNQFYVLDTVLSTTLFSGLVIERIESNGSEKYFCTFIKSGNLIISMISIAFNLRSGSYTNEEGGRSPFWAEKKACISKDLVLTTEDGQSTIRKYKILDNGKVVKI